MANANLYVDEHYCSRISVLTPSLVEFGVIPKEHWYQPDWIDEDRAKKSRDKMVEENIIYGGKPLRPEGFIHTTTDT